MAQEPRSALTDAWRDGSWDGIDIDDYRMPGRVHTLTVTPERDVQSSQTPGTDGPDLKDQGYKGAKVDLVIEIWRAAKMQEMANILGVLNPRQPGGIKYPHKIAHPITDVANVTQVYIESWSVGMPDEQGRWLVTISMHEWFPPKKKKQTQQADKTETTGNGGALGSNAVPPPDPKNNGANFP